MTKQIYFDMDGTIANFYEVDGWLDDLIAENTRPYEVAKPLCNFSILARLIHKMEKEGFTFGIISWGSKNGSDEFLEAIREAKLAWLARHLPSVEFSEIHIVKYGTPKSSCGNGILFDDEERNRNEWGENAFDVDDLLEKLKGLYKKAL